MLLCRTWPLRCKAGKPELRSFCPCFAPAALQQKFAMLCHAQGHHCLPAFGRSCAADGKKNKKLCHCERGTSEVPITVGTNFAVHRVLFERVGMASDAY